MFFLSFFVSVAFLYSELWRALIFQKSIKIVSGCLGFFFLNFIYVCASLNREKLRFYDKNKKYFLILDVL